MNEDKATRYHRLGRRTSLLSTAWMFVLLLLLLFSGASAWLRNWSGAAASAIGLGRGAVATVALYVLVLSVFVDLAALPFSFYKGFVLERRYGLGNETLRHWVADHLKAMAVGLLFGLAGAEFVFATLRRWPDQWWLVSGIGYSVVAIGLVNIAPVLLLPLFYRFKPLRS